MAKDNLKGEFISAADDVRNKFGAIGSLIIVVYEDGSMNIGCKNLNYKEIKDIVDRVQLEAYAAYQ